MAESLSVFAKITPKAEHLAAATEAVAGILDRTRAEPGCRHFSLHRDDEGAIYLMELWESEQALKSHYDEPYTKAVFASYEEWLAKPPEILKMRPVATS